MPAADALQGHKEGEGIGKAGQGLEFESLLLYIECQSICKCRLINDAIIVATRRATSKKKKKKWKGLKAGLIQRLRWTSFKFGFMQTKC